jgi:hypothetical protein
MNDMPQRIQLSRRKGWRKPDNCVNVARPTIWGNPFTHDDKAEAVEAYRLLIRGGTQSFDMGPGKLQFATRINPDTLHWSYSDWVRKHIAELHGKDLACWCPLDGPCHADVLLKLANEESQPMRPDPIAVSEEA